MNYLIASRFLIFRIWFCNNFSSNTIKPINFVSIYPIQLYNTHEQFLFKHHRSHIVSIGAQTAWHPGTLGQSRRGERGWAASVSDLNRLLMRWDDGDSWWFMVIHGDSWWIMERKWWLMVINGESWRENGDLWWFVMINNDLWWLMMIYDD